MPSVMQSQPSVEEASSGGEGGAAPKVAPSGDAQVNPAMQVVESSAELAGGVVAPGSSSSTGSGVLPTKAMLVSPSVAIGCMLLGVLLMVYTLMQARRRKRGAKVVDPADERSANRVGVSYATQTTNQALAELAMQVRRMHGQLRTAHERIEQLEQQSKHEPAVKGKGGGVAGPSVGASTGAGLGAGGAMGGAMVRGLVDPKPASMHVVANANPVHQQVYGLSDSGLTPVEIAQATNLPTGQVELILNLRKALGLQAK